MYNNVDILLEQKISWEGPLMRYIILKHRFLNDNAELDIEISYTVFNIIIF